MTETPAETVDELNPHAPPASQLADPGMSVEEAPSEPTAVPGPEQKKLNKNDLKRMRIYQERIQKHKKAHPNATPEQIQQALSAEDYAKLPIEKKLEKTQQFFGLALGRMEKRVDEQLNQMMQNLIGMDGSLHVNFRAVAKALEKVGVDVETQKKLIAEVAEEIKAEVEAEKKEEEAAMAAAKAQSEKLEATKNKKVEERTNAETALKDAETVGLTPKEGHPSLPPEARVF